MSELPLPAEKYQEDLLSWIDAAVAEGESILQAEPAYNEIDKSIAYIMGDQIDPRRPKDLAGINDNRTKKIILETVAALTDIHPLFGFKTFNLKFSDQGALLDKLARAWWVNSFSDLKLADVVRYAAGPGTGYCEVNWDASVGGGVGDIVLTPRDPRDILPIRPTFDFSVQSWEGVIIRSAETVNSLRARFPEQAHRLLADNQPSSVFARTWATARKIMTATVGTPSAVDHLIGNRARNVPSRVPTCEKFTIYVKDRRLWTGAEPLVMGDPKTTWCYTVYPIGSVKPDGTKATAEDARLYPRGRLIIATRRAVLYDGPNPYWHGMFPVCRLCLDPWPWTLLGLGVARDIIPLNDALNELINGVLDYVRKILRPGLIGDKRAVPESMWNRLDTRLAGMKIKQNPTAGKGIELTTQDPLPADVLEIIKTIVGEMDYLGGVANMQALMQLQQAPAADSIEKMLESLSPLLRLKGRLLEAFLRDMGEMVKACFFQFYTLPRRVAVLGEAGIDFADFDFNPGSLVPSMHPADEGYEATYDYQKSHAERARAHQRNFAFQITPNSLLAISQLSRKLTYLQLARAGWCDPWTLWEILEIPNAGSPPGDVTTITERIIAASALGLMGQVSPAGRKASGQEPPSVQEKPDEAGFPRTTVSESGG